MDEGSWGPRGQAEPGTRPPPLLLLFAVTVTGITVNTLVTPVIPEILDGLEAARGLAGVFVAAGTAPGIIIAPLIGVLADRHGRREVLVPCVLLFSVAGGLGTVAPNVWVLIALRLLQGVGSAGVINLVVVIIGDHWEGAERARIIGRNAAVLTVAIAVLPPIGGLLTEVGDWRAPFAVYPLGLVTAWLAATYLPRTERRDVTFREQITEATPYLRAPTVVRTLGAGVVVFLLIFGLLLTVLPVYVDVRFGVGPSWRGVLLGLPAVTSTVAALALGRLTERFGRHRLLLVSAALFAAALAIIAGAPVFALVAAGVLVFGLGQGLMIPALQDVAAGSAPRSSRGAVVAVWVGAARFGQTIGPLVAMVGFGAVGGPLTLAAGAVVCVLMLALLGPRSGGETDRTAPV
jgi:MFS family permease